MTEAIVLADALVEAGIGSCDRSDADAECHVWRTPNHIGPAYPVEQFITDWRVAGKVLEHSYRTNALLFKACIDGIYKPGMKAEELPRAIIEAWYAARETE